MGDASDMADVERFLRSETGKQYLKEIVEMLKGRTIVDVTFENNVHRVVTTLHLDEGATFILFQPSLEIDVLREEFEEAIEEEYYKDYPERKPM